MNRKRGVLISFSEDSFQKGFFTVPGNVSQGKSSQGEIYLFESIVRLQNSTLGQRQKLQYLWGAFSGWIGKQNILKYQNDGKHIALPIWSPSSCLSFSLVYIFPSLPSKSGCNASPWWGIKDEVKSCREAKIQITEYLNFTCTFKKEKNAGAHLKFWCKQLLMLGGW